MDGVMSTFGLPPFELGQDFSIPPHLRNPENFNARFPNARFPSTISNIFRAGDYASKSVSDDHGGRHMDMSNGIEDISDIGENELPISVAAMNEPYLTSGTTTLGCTQQQHSSLHTAIPPLQSSNFFSDPVTSEADSYSRDMPFASPMDFNIKNEQEPRFHLNPSSAISSISSALQPNKPNIMRSIYGPNLNPSFPDPASQSMYTYIHQTPVSNDSKAPQFYRPFPGFPPFDTPESIQDNHGFSKSDDSRIFPPVPSSHRPQIIDRQKPQGTNRADAHDVEDVDDANRCKNTVEGTKTSVRRLKKWYKDKYGKSIDMNTVTRQMALEMLKDFFLEIRDTRPGKEGNEYEPVTLTTYRNGLRRYFLERKCPPAVENFDLADREFDVVNYGLVSKRNELKRKGKGNHPNVVESITEEQLERMWASGAIGVHAPRPLLRLQWWINTVSHGIRGRMAHHDLSIDDFRISRGPDGKIIIDHMKAGSNKRPRADDEKDNPRSKKKCKARVAATDGSERDPVRAFEVYLRHRPPGISSFYLTPKHKPKGDIWFNKVPMGKNSIGRIMREIKAIAGIG